MKEIFKTVLKSGRMVKKLFFALITMGLFFSNTLKAETVLYCQSEVATGFFNEGGVWKETSFKLDRYTVKFNDDFSLLEGVSYKPMECSIQYPTQKPNLVFCLNSFGSYQTFIYNKTSKRFLFSNFSAAGYVTNDSDTDNMSAGTCQSF